VVTESEYLIVGQGLAGSCLAYGLLQAGKSVHIVDNGRVGTASYVGAGIMNPLVFKYITQSWKADVMLPFARSFYKLLESRFNSRFIYDLPIARILVEDEYQRWLTKQHLEHVGRWADSEICYPINIAQLNYNYGAILINDAAWVDMALLVSYFREYFIQQQVLLEENFEFQKLQLGSDHIRYKQISALGIIFCEGPQAVKNPYFGFVPFRPVKGELLKVSIPLLDERFIINSNIFILPLGNHLFRVGSSYDWDDLSPQPTKLVRDRLISSLQALIKLPFELVEHTAGIRPSIADRRPVAGRHPDHPNMFILNGLGAKGAMLAPLIAQQLIDLLAKGNPVWDDIDLKRFKRGSRTTMA
jgi:glycine oxidase